MESLLYPELAEQDDEIDEVQSLIARSEDQLDELRSIMRFQYIRLFKNLFFYVLILLFVCFSIYYFNFRNYDNGYISAVMNTIAVICIGFLINAYSSVMDTFEMIFRIRTHVRLQFRAMTKVYEEMKLGASNGAATV